MLENIPDRLTPEYRTHLDRELNAGIEAGELDACLALLEGLIQRFPAVPAFHRDMARVYHKLQAFWPCAEAWARFCSVAVHTSPVAEKYCQAWKTREAMLGTVRMTIDPGCQSINDQVRFALVEGKYEQAERKALEFLLEPADRVLECGAGAGFLGVCAQKLCPGISYVAVEANPQLQPLIAANQALNGVSFHVISGAVAESSGNADFLVMENFMASQILSEVDTVKTGVSAAQVLAVPQFGLNELLASTGANFLIMDIEGAEYAALLSSILPGVNKLLVELHPALLSRQRIAAILRHLLALGFEPELDVCTANVFCLLRTGNTCS